jgi:predicted SAM-dependent methyltransferase
MKTIPPLDIYPSYGLEARRSNVIKKLILRFLPLHTFKHVRAEFPLMLLRLRSGSVRRKFKHSDNMLVNIAPGRYGKAGWVNVDVYRAPLISCLYDCRKSLPFPDESVRAIFSEHFLEHIDYTEEVPYFLMECHRVLKKGGVLRLILPDAEKYLYGYCENGWEGLSKIRPLDPQQVDPHFHCKYNTKMELINVLFRQGREHQFAYDFATLHFVLRRYGFSTVVRQDYGQSLLPELCLDRPERAAESLYVDARK